VDHQWPSTRRIMLHKLSKDINIIFDIIRHMNYRLDTTRAHFIGSLGAFSKLWNVSVSLVISVSPSVRPTLCPSVRMEQLDSHWTDLHNIGFWVFFENLSREYRLHWNCRRRISTLQEGQCTLTTSRWAVLIMRNLSDKFTEKNQTTHFYVRKVFPKTALFMRKCEKLETERPQMTI